MTAPHASAPPEPIRWSEDGSSIVVLDQTELPAREVERRLATVEEIEEAIATLRVRGAPLIGITAAMGVAALARRRAGGEPDLPAGELASEVRAWAARLAEARPTAVNLGWALERMEGVAEGALEGGRGAVDAAAFAEALAGEADAIREEDRAMCRRMGEHALPLIGGAARLLTHCNAGALATGGVGTALAPIYLAAAAGPAPRVFVGETRPLLQGSRLTAWELRRAGVDVTVMSDGTAGALFATDPPDAVLVGADRIAANGDVANKIGTYGLAVLARHHRVPFLVLAPTSTVDLETATGAAIPIEHRSPDELRRGFGRLTAPEDVAVLSPAFDVTPAELVTAIVTEQGVHRPPFGPALAAAVEDARRERKR
ncbi:MAG: S-methyl-5-thioribose-1-phosphate isomerase [Gemmatimonadota bacterium]|jgi:methylthioribose-1-phosphate isomerase